MRELLGTKSVRSKNNGERTDEIQLCQTRARKHACQFACAFSVEKVFWRFVAQEQQQHCKLALCTQHGSQSQVHRASLPRTTEIERRKSRPRQNRREYPSAFRPQTIV